MVCAVLIKQEIEIDKLAFSYGEWAHIYGFGVWYAVRSTRCVSRMVHKKVQNYHWEWVLNAQTSRLEPVVYCVLLCFIGVVVSFMCEEGYWNKPWFRKINGIPVKKRTQSNRTQLAVLGSQNQNYKKLQEMKSSSSEGIVTMMMNRG